MVGWDGEGAEVGVGKGRVSGRGAGWWGDVGRGLRWNSEYWRRTTGHEIEQLGKVQGAGFGWARVTSRVSGY